MRPSALYVQRETSLPLLIAEVGVRDGVNSGEMLREMRVERLYLIDHYLPYQDGDNQFFTQMDQNILYRRMFINMKPNLDKTVFITRESLFAASLFDEGFFDYVYIDACHDVNCVMADINAWWPKVKIGGYMGGHDYQMHGPRVAVDGFISFNKLDLITDMGDDWLIQKSK